MSKTTKKLHNRALRVRRVRSRVHGTVERPRLLVRISNRHIQAQIINDTSAQTLVAISTVGKDNIGSTMTEKAAWAGTEVAKQAKQVKVKKVVLDRGSKLYHGRVAALAAAARAAGLEF